MKIKAKVIILDFLRKNGIFSESSLPILCNYGIHFYKTKYTASTYSRVFRRMKNRKPEAFILIATDEKTGLRSWKIVNSGSM